jgi:hypothetical protein
MDPAGKASDPSAILALGLRFWEAKALLSAVELGVFTALAAGPLPAKELTVVLGIHERAAVDFFDALVALGALARSNSGEYANSPQAEQFLVASRPSYMGGALEMANARLYPVWGKLTEALRSGQPQNEAKDESDYYGELVRDPNRLRTFLRGMTGLSMGASRAIAEKFPWAEYGSFVDVGGAQGVLSIQLASTHEHLEGTTFDLAPVAPFFEECVAAAGLSHRLRFKAGDFFSAPLPSADVLIMGHVLHNWRLSEKRELIRKAYAALPDGGALLVYEALIDDERRQATFGLLMSLNMLLVTAGGFVFTGAECRAWMLEAGFREVRVEHLAGPDSMVVGRK